MSVPKPQLPQAPAARPATPRPSPRTGKYSSGRVRGRRRMIFRSTLEADRPKPAPAQARASAPTRERGTPRPRSGLDDAHTDQVTDCGLRAHETDEHHASTTSPSG